MKLPSYRMSTVSHSDNVLNAILAAYLVYWICLLPVWSGSGNPGKTAIYAMMLPAAVLMLWVAIHHIKRLNQAARVLGHLQAPHQLWREMMHGALLRIFLYWVLLSAGSFFVLRLPASGLPPLAGVALLSLAGSLAILRRLVGARMLDHVIKRSLFVELAFWLIVIVAISGPVSLLDTFGQLASTFHLAFALTLPALLLALALHWNRTVPVYRWSAKAPDRSFLKGTRDWLRRISTVTWPSREEAYGYGAESSDWVKTGWGTLSTILSTNLIFMGRVGNHVPGGALSLQHAMMLLLISSVLAGSLLCRDLHWRTFLLPGGMRRGSIATRLFITTLAVQSALLIAWAIIYVLLKIIGGEHPWSTIGQNLVNCSPVIVELAFVTGLAVLLRGLPGPGYWAICMAAVTVFVMVAEVFMRESKSQPIVFELNGPVYLLGLAVAVIAMLALANRLWTPNKLHPGIRL